MATKGPQHSPRFALSPDGALLAYVGPGPAAGTRQLWIKRRDQLARVVVAGTEDAEQPVFSPDGTRLAFYVRGPNSAAVRVVPVDGGPPITLATSDQIAPSSSASAGFRGIGLAWGDDGYLYMDGQDRWGVRRVRATGGLVEHAAVRDTTNGLYWWPDPLPGGRDILVTLGRWTSPVSGFRVAVTNPATGVTRVLVSGVHGRYATSGHLLYVTAEGVLMAAPFDPKRAVMTGPARGWRHRSIPTTRVGAPSLDTESRSRLTARAWPMPPTGRGWSARSGCATSSLAPSSTSPWATAAAAPPGATTRP